jgi:hypothetical protein
MLTGKQTSDMIGEFAKHCSEAGEYRSKPRTLPSTNSAIKFEDTNLRLCPALVLDPKLSAQARTVRIFDNIVERASREMT